MAKIFICYRREDSKWPAQWLYNDLTNHFGAESVVFDVDTIPLGTDFREFLNNQVSKCDILLAVIGDQWIELLKQRIDQPNDFVRIEIQAALERNIPVVPVLVGKAPVPNEKNLPPELVTLAYRQATEVHAGPDLQTHLKRLISGLDRLIAEKDAEKERRRKAEENRKRRETEEAKRKTEEERKRKKAEEADERTRIAETERKAEKKREQKEEQKRRATPKTYTNAIGMEFVLIPAGNFMMGSHISAEEGASKYGLAVEWFKVEHPQHKVGIGKEFYLQSTQVTRGQWQKVMGSNQSKHKKFIDDCPAETFSWPKTQSFIKKINEMERTNRYCLPTEAEWEYACRAGSTTEFYFGDDAKKLGEYAWYEDNSEGKPHPVGQKKPNAWGLYDMHGNVSEWCQDWYGFYSSNQITDPRGPSEGRSRVLRGGSWCDPVGFLRSATRRGYDPYLRGYFNGFRVAWNP